VARELGSWSLWLDPRLRWRGAGLLVAAIACGSSPVPAEAGQKAVLHTSFTPDRLGTPTTIEFGFRIASTVADRAPSPLTDVDLHLPAGLGLLSSTLGLVNCDPAALLARGAPGCPANARIGYGSALVAVPGEGEILYERATVDTVLGPPKGETVEVLFYAEGTYPVFAQLVFPGQILSDRAPFSARLNTAIPLIPTWPEGPFVSVVRLSSTIGPLGLTYYKRLRGRLVGYRPRGIRLPARCPRKGFPFRADFAFLDRSHARSVAYVPCPR
jgi:hypothetical protein